MESAYVKAALMTGWMLAIGSLAYNFDITSVPGWTVVAALSLVPPGVVRHLCRVPAQTTSEAIREALR